MAFHAIRMTDGTVAVLQTVPQPVLDRDGQPVVDKAGTPVLRDPTVEECFAKWHPEEQAKVVGHRQIDPASLPKNRAFRDAWTHDGVRFSHDMTKARRIHRERLRQDRQPLLAALDVAYQRAEESGNTAEKARIAARKQALRDAPADPRIEAAQTTVALVGIKLPEEE